MIERERYKVFFPTIIEWQKIVLRQNDSKQFWRQDFYDYYRTKFEIALEKQPKSICEIGVRWGYSAFSFLSAVPTARYTGYDIVAGTHGGAKGIDTFGYVAGFLHDNFPQADIRLVHADTRNLVTLTGPFDFIHVDGDHSVEGCRHDLELALGACSPGGTILVDDYNYIKGVTVAADDFCRNWKYRIAETQTKHSLRGELIITKGGDHD